MDLEGRNLSSVVVQKSGHFLPVYRFVQQYISHLLPALERIEGERAKQSKSRREHVIRYEVDMALALSAKGFTWSSALRSKLEKERDLAIKKPAHIIQFQSSEIEGNMRFLLFPQLKGNLNIHYSSTAPNKYCIHKKFCEYYSDPCTVKGNLGKVVYDKVCWRNTKKSLYERKTINSVYEAKYKRWRPKLVVKRLKMTRKIKEKRSVQARIETLRKLTPGGNGMETEVLFKELGNYITCLQMQVKVLHHLTEYSARDGSTMN
ncbi:uncharacterized protein LOC131071926 [Cryptomeria japonica]|uniref:uncharacterized protein LOC131071926 n=1 Tax=Cryptomeria japonica TaxID=3369 RepID=UPI0025AB673F|nr:uncharacterized protein LOC131071926 [Cryptomeria japonica]